ncbi:MAG TPA: STAS domain-containing protein [Candidatus Xenobia bacterium]|jgi:anti-sigma B factor antagonist
MSDNLLELKINSSTLAHEAHGLKVQGELDINTSPQLRTAIDQAVAAGHHLLVVDFTEVPYIDSTGLGVLVSRRKVVNELKGHLVIISNNPHIHKIFDITGLNRLFPMYRTEEEFVKTWQPPAP